LDSRRAVSYAISVPAQLNDKLGATAMIPASGLELLCGPRRETFDVKRWWRVVVPAVVALAAVGVGVTTALAGELDNDPVNNRLATKTSLVCNSDGSVTLRWTSIAPAEAASMTAMWYDATADPDLRSPKPAKIADRVAAVRRTGGRASGAFRLTGVPDGHLVALFVDAWSQANGKGTQVYGLGRNLDTFFHCVDGRPTG
jgi:hypothetical protein